MLYAQYEAEVVAWAKQIAENGLANTADQDGLIGVKFEYDRETLDLGAFLMLVGGDFGGASVQLQLSDGTQSLSDNMYECSERERMQSEQALVQWVQAGWRLAEGRMFQRGFVGPHDSQYVIDLDSGVEVDAFQL